ncbi:MAG: hypothetical protein GEV10_20270 [Streptosporangiales bacterium]|nr:hypothetical protein [Streptosporangiales bacterium]
MDTTDVQQASERLENAVRALTRVLTDSDRSDDDVTACDWDVLRALAEYQDAAERPDNPAVLEWVPPLLEIEETAGPEDKVIQFATWVFTVTDEQRAVTGGAERLAGLGEERRPETAASVVGALVDEELAWPDIDAYGQLGLDLDLVRYSTHTMLGAGADGADVDIDTRIGGSDPD